MKKAQQDGRGIWEWQIVTYSLLALLGFMCAVMFYKGFTEEGVRILIRNTARFSFFFFVLAFVASALHKLMKSSITWWLRMNRKYLGITFALGHLIHLVTIVILQWKFHPVFEQADLVSLFGGGIAYIFVLMMLVTSFDKFKSPLAPKSWSLLHTFGGYWIWAVFLSTFHNRTDEPIHWIFVAILVGVLILRLNQLRLNRITKLATN